MLPNERIDLIVKLLKEQKCVNVQELASEFGVSVVTIRRDLDKMVNSGIAKRVYGGAALNETYSSREVIPPNNYSKRSENLRLQKVAIAQAAAELVHKYDAIFLDIGTTVAELAKCLVDRSDITVLTNSVEVLNILGNANMEVYCVGGRLRGGQASLYGDITSSVFSRFNIDRAFLGVGGVTIEDGVTYFFPDNAEIDRIAVASSRESILLADSSKFGVRRLAKACDLKDIGTIVTDNGISDEYSQAIRKLGVSLITADV